MRKLAVLAMALGLAACGVRADLKPLAGRQLPAAPYGREDRPTAAKLLTPTQQAVPGRSVELRQRSEQRADDPFALPPKE